MAYRFRDQKPGDVLELLDGQLVIKIGPTQAFCLRGNDMTTILHMPPTADVTRIMDREDLISTCRGLS